MNDFVKKTFSAILQKSKAGGYGWWSFQNLNWYGDPDPNKASPPFEHTYGEYREGYQGLIRRALPTTDMATGYAGLRKLASQNFINASSLPVYTDNYGPTSSTYINGDLYYNSYAYPSNTLVYTTSTGYVRRGKIRGKVVEDTPQPYKSIKGAIINACSFDKGTGNTLHTYTTFTDENGYFEIDAYDREPSINGADPNLDRTFDDIKVAAFGCTNTAELGWGGGDFKDPVDPVNNPANPNTVFVFKLKSLQSQFDKSVPSGTVAIGATQNYQANSTLTATNFIVDGSGTNGGHSELKARNYVYLKPGFLAKGGSDVHIYLQPIALACSDIAALGRPDLTSVEEESILKNQETNEVLVYPNPTTGFFTAAFPESLQESKNTIVVVDLLGRELFTVSNIKNSINLDLSGKQAGVYFVKFIQDNVTLAVKKVALD